MTHRNLVSAKLDFWLLGGFSLLLWPVLHYLEYAHGNAPGFYAPSLAAVAVGLTAWLNFPHLIGSYKLAYGQGPKLVRAYWLQLIVVPVALFVAYAYVYARTDRMAFIALYQLMLFTFGWHLGKQAYGATLVIAQYRGYRFSAKERLVLRYLVLAIAAQNALAYQSIKGRVSSLNMVYRTLELPDWVATAAAVPACALIAATLALVVYKYLRENARPSATMLVPLFAFVLWWTPGITPGSPEAFVGVFHAIQYLAFLWAIDLHRHSSLGRSYPAARVVAQLAAYAVIARLALGTVPGLLDGSLGTAASYGNGFFFVAMLVFLNVHHYFIDNVIWRFDKSDVREHLL